MYQVLLYCKYLPFGIVSPYMNFKRHIIIAITKQKIYGIQHYYVFFSWNSGLCWRIYGITTLYHSHFDFIIVYVTLYCMQKEPVIWERADLLNFWCLFCDRIMQEETEIFLAFIYWSVFIRCFLKLNFQGFLSAVCNKGLLLWISEWKNEGSLLRLSQVDFWLDAWWKGHILDFILD